MAIAIQTRPQLPEWLADGIDAEPTLRAALNRRDELVARKGAITGELRASELASAIAEERASEAEIAALAGTSTRSAATAAAHHAQEIQAQPAALRREDETLARALVHVDAAIEQCRVAARQQALEAVRPLLMAKFDELLTVINQAVTIDRQMRALRDQLGDAAAGHPGGYKELSVSPGFSPAGQHVNFFGGSFAEKLIIEASNRADGTL